MQEMIKDADVRMQKTLETLKADLSKVRTGRANPGFLEHVKVSCYGSESPLTQVASISVESARVLVVTPWDKSILSAVEKAIMSADLGLNPNSVGNLIRVPMPPLNEERRKEMVKIVRDEAEGARVAVRNIRRDFNQKGKELLKEKALSEDENRRLETEIQKHTDKFITEIDKILATKEAELMEV